MKLETEEIKMKDYFRYVNPYDDQTVEVSFHDGNNDEDPSITLMAAVRKKTLYLIRCDTLMTVKVIKKGIIIKKKLPIVIGYKKFDSDIERLYGLKKHFIEKALEIEGISINGLTCGGLEDIKSTAPHIISLPVCGVRAEVLLHALEDYGVYVSAGSACSTHKRTPSATLTSIALDKPLLESTVRISMSALTTEEDIDDALRAISEVVPRLKMFTRK